MCLFCHLSNSSNQKKTKKTDKENQIKRNLVVGMPRERPGDKFGTSQGHPGRLGRFMCKFAFKGQNARSAGQTGQTTGQMGHVQGTDGTQTRGDPAKILYVYWFFSFPIILGTLREPLRRPVFQESSPQPEIIAKLIPKTLFRVTEMRFSKKIIPKTFFHVIL